MASAQYYGALAAGLVPSPIYNPILLKPASPTGSHMIILGKPAGVVGSKNWVSRDRERLWKIVRSALDNIMSRHEYVVLEGAGSPAEINLKPYDITNLRPIIYGNGKAVLVADIDRGGSFAQIVGTMELMSPEERGLIKVFVLNKFRGDESLLREGIEYLKHRYGLPVVVLPYVEHNLPEEDALEIFPPPRDGDITVGVVLLRHLSNNDDFDPLLGNVNIRYVRRPSDLMGLDLVIIPGSRYVMDDLRWMRTSGLAGAVVEYAKAGGFVFGICGGYQMLGYEIVDEVGIEEMGRMPGLGIADVRTEFKERKILRLSSGKIKDYVDAVGGVEVSGYQIHHGVSLSSRPFAELDGVPDGYYGGNVLGTYLHGIFANVEFSERFFNMLRRRVGLPVKEFHYIHPIRQLDVVLDTSKPRLEDILSALL